MPTSKFDIVVIGAGPAGATAAYRLARNGFKTLLLEKEKLPRYKACGGALTNKVFQILDFDIAPLVEDSITRIQLTYRHRAQVNLDFAKPPVALVMRDAFDNYLVDRAAEQGAVIHDAEAVKQISLNAYGARVKTGRDEYACEIVVGADGANGITSRAANLAPRSSIGAALEMEIAVGAEQLDVWRHKILLDLGAIPYGYAWIFPKADHLSVGLGTYVRGPLLPHFAQRAGQARSDLRARLYEWLASEPTLRERRVLVERGHLVPLGGRATPLSNSRVILVGDAGGLIEPFLAEGIYYAIRSGQIAAEVIAGGFGRPHQDLSRYTSRVEAEFLPAFQSAAGMSRFTYRFPQVSLAALSIAPPLRRSIGGVMDGHDNMTGGLWRLVRATGNWLDAL